MYLTNEQVALIKLDTARTSTAIAKDFEVSTATICNIRNGKTRTGKKKESIPVEQRFWNYVNKLGSLVVYPGATLPGCWIWTGALLEGDYGGFQRNGRCWGAHIVSYEIHFGPANGECICHHCDNPICVNPSHLFKGSPADNARDRDSKQRQARGERSGASKLTEEKVITIRLDPRTMATIAKDYGITAGEVGHIKRKRIWKHVEGAVVYSNRRRNSRNIS